MPAIDITGKKFNHWTVIKRAPNNKRGDAMWLCECDCDAHTQQIVKGSSLRSGHSKSCGCLKKQTAAEIGRKNSIDLTGKTFGLLTVLEKGYSKNQQIYWKCQCSCKDKTIVYVSSAKLKSGHTKSCGCLSQKNLLGETFGKLTVIRKTNKRAEDGCVIWECQCSCENKTIVEVPTDDLTTGRKLHCGCDKQESLGEIKIAYLLKENNISFEKEKKFLDCKDRRPLSFDFYVNNSYIIEFDGIQHFKAANENSTSWNTLEKLKITQNHDKIKNQWCKENNIPIIRIPYTRYKDLIIEDLIPETSKFLLI